MMEMVGGPPQCHKEKECQTHDIARQVSKTNTLRGSHCPSIPHQLFSDNVFVSRFCLQVGIPLFVIREQELRKR